MASKSRFRSLTRRADFLGLRSNGKSIHITSWLLVNCRTTDRLEVRCGWTIPRQVGGAVVRNRLRRWGREYLRRWALASDKSLDINLIFKRKDKGFYGSISHREFDEAMDRLVEKISRMGK